MFNYEADVRFVLSEDSNNSCLFTVKRRSETLFFFFSLPLFLLDFLEKQHICVSLLLMVCFMTCDMFFFLFCFLSLSAFAIEETLPLTVNGWGGGGGGLV